jgi:2,3-bisphosphoglycerate-independent phosphoglycerate mutase
MGKKYIVVLIDGASDYPLAELGNKTPLQSASKPVIDELARRGVVGMVKTIPDGVAPGSDSANLSILGYDPRVYSTGRSSLEAVSMGIELSENDVTFRCNLVTLSDESHYPEKTMLDYSAGEITTEEAKILVTDIAQMFETEQIRFYPGVSYRHIIVWRGGIGETDDTLVLIPPHDISGRKIAHYLPKGKNSRVFLDYMLRSGRILRDHPVNAARIKECKNPANSIWIWAKATKPALGSFYEKYGINGSVISAVDLVKGIGICAGLKPVDVKGATGNIHTDFEGKARAALGELENGQDFVYIHIEAPDECGHQGDFKEKIRSIELIDSKVIRILKEQLDFMNTDYSMMILPDHPTPIIKRTHTSDPVPFLIYDSKDPGTCTGTGADKGTGPVGTGSQNNSNIYDEFYPQATGLFISEGHKLMDYFLSKKD